jgi:hypothetical protein
MSIDILEFNANLKAVNTGRHFELASATQPEPTWEALVRRQVSALRFGVVQITVHESQVVQVETTEKIRLPPVTKTTNLEQTTAKENLVNQQDRP